MSGRVQRSQRLGAGVEGFTLAPEWQGWNSWRWGKERDTLGIERKEKGGIWGVDKISFLIWVLVMWVCMRYLMRDQ